MVLIIQIVTAIYDSRWRGALLRDRVSPRTVETFGPSSRIQWQVKSVDTQPAETFGPSSRVQWQLKRALTVLREHIKPSSGSVSLQRSQ